MSKLYLGTIPINRAIFNLVDLRKFYLNGVEINIGPDVPTGDLIQLTSDNKGLILKQGLPYIQDDFSTGTSQQVTLTEDITISDILSDSFYGDIEYYPNIQNSLYPKKNATISNIITAPSNLNVTEANILATFSNLATTTNMYLGNNFTTSKTFVLEFDTTLTNLHVGGYIQFDDYLDMYYWLSSSLGSGTWAYSLEVTVTDGNGETYTMETKNGSKNDIECYFYYNAPKWTITTDTCTIHRKLTITMSDSSSTNSNRKIELRKARFAVKEYYIDYSIPYYLYIESFKDGDFSDTQIGVRGSSSDKDLASFKLNEADNTIYNLTIL